jgi:hypothetical protein
VQYGTDQPVRHGLDLAFITDVSGVQRYSVGEIQVTSSNLRPGF